MFAFFIFVKNEDMKKRDYLFNMTNLILNRLRFHAPKLYSTDVDFDKLIKLGVDPSLPVFKFDKTMTRPLFKCFERAKSVCDFNLILPEENPKAEKKLGALVLKNNPDINKLNINYKACSAYHLKTEETFVEIDGMRQNLCMHDFYLQASGMADEVRFYVKEFVLSGRNFYFEFLNTSDKPKSIRLSLNIPLKQSYYYFQKRACCIEVYDLFSCEKSFFNFTPRKANFVFSCIDGVESSTHACINVSCEVCLKPKQKRVHFFNYGTLKFSLAGQGEMEMFLKEAERQTNERFNLRIKSSDKAEQRLLNQTLPERIYMAWLRGEQDKASEIEYGKLKEKFMIESRKGFSFAGFANLSSIQFFTGSHWRTISIEKGEGQGFLQIGKTKFFGKNFLSFKELKNTSDCLVLKGE